ncbi:unnamed protein product [Psylliodes chrysocephalus]|uniref:Uncharacterized protein n=1 Tax=Psylliodes chrysocephalus TaxID=3402493 RepID=A0A9P0CSB7_9CUCU|nr:unnamed protein product [Psylliodes chrysocephala]
MPRKDPQNIASHDQLFDKLKEYFDDKISELKETIKLDKVELLDKIEENNLKIDKVENDHKNLASEVKLLKNIIRKYNIIVHGIPAEKENLSSEVNLIFNDILGGSFKENQIRNVFRLGKIKSNSPVLVELLCYTVVKDIFRKSYKLKSSKYSISRESSKEEREEYKTLKQFKEKASVSNIPTKIKNNKLVLLDSGRSYTVDDLKAGKITFE